jgi:Xaa-Pro aminopeptidase
MAHVDVMREVHPGMLEYQLEARFLFHIAYHGNTRRHRQLLRAVQF